MAQRIRHYLLLFLALAVQTTIAQDFRYNASLPTAPAPGFYKIPLSSELLSRSKSNQSDIRLLDDERREIPFILLNKKSSLSGRSFIEFKILATEIDKNYTTVVIKTNKRTIDHLSIFTSASSREGYCSLSGSPDAKKWSLIQEKILLQNRHDPRIGSFIQTAEMPAFRSPYIRLQFRNDIKFPHDILKAGIFNDIDSTEEDWIANPALKFDQKDSCNGYSYIYLRNPQRHLIEKLDLKLVSQGVASRNANLFVLNPAGRVVQYVTSAKLKSVGLVSIPVYPCRHELLLLEIENRSNPPLCIKEMKSSHLEYYLVAYLKSKTRYKLVSGNDEIEAPGNEMEQFFAGIPLSIPILNHGPVEELDLPTIRVYRWKDIRLWVVCSTLLVTIAFTWRILKMKGKMKVATDFNQSGRKGIF